MSTPSTLPRSDQGEEAARADRTVSDEQDVQRLLSTVEDADCRSILEATREEPLTATELSESCSMALSTAYRKLDMLVDEGLIEERTRIRRSGKHASEYVGLLEDLVVSLDPAEGVRVRVSRCQAPARAEPFSTRP